jgi:co-chaperonin GroES (HSP10)
MQRGSALYSNRGYKDEQRTKRMSQDKEKKLLLVVGDRVLIRVEEGEERSKVGLYLPPTAVDNQAVQGGYIIATGPGLPLPDFGDHADEPWRTSGIRETRFVPMQARPGDYALFFRKAAVELTFEGERYIVVPQSAILALARDDKEYDDS